MVKIKAEIILVIKKVVEMKSVVNLINVIIIGIRKLSISEIKNNEYICNYNQKLM